mmetsp:Transcript_2023/g.2104  ORF Transcript_2023/g.2104 Transcript_2023/m.2104 type:complete len:618 (-) Transcript_2023:123-1976(-)
MSTDDEMQLNVLHNLELDRNGLSSDVSRIVKTDWMSEISFDDFHFLLASYLLPIDLQQLVRVSHMWHDKVRYDIQRFHLSDESFAWAKSFEDLCKRASQILEDSPYLFFSANTDTPENQLNQLQDEIEFDEVDSDDEDEEVSEEEDNENLDNQKVENTVEEFHRLSLHTKQDDQDKDDIEPDKLPSEVEGNDDFYDLFLQELDYIQGSSQRNICFDPYFFCLENEEYREDFCQLLSNPARQLCFYLQNTSFSEFHSLNIRPSKVVFLMTRMHRLEDIHLHFLNHIDTVELHGDLSLFSLNGLSGIRVLKISHFHSLRTIGGNLSSLEEVRISDCPELQNLIGLESVRKARLGGRLNRLMEISPIQNCVELYLSRSNAQSIKGFNNLRSLTLQFCYSLEFDPDFIPFSKLQSLCLYGGHEKSSVFRNLQELTLKSSWSLASLKMVDTFPQPLRKIAIIDCPLISSLEGLSRVQSIELSALASLHKLTGINPFPKFLIVSGCDIQDWGGVSSVEEVTIDYCGRDSDIITDLGRFDEIVKKKLTLRNSKHIDRVIGLERIPILEFDGCIGLEHFSNLQNEKLIFDKTSTVLYSGRVRALSDSGRYLREDYGDKIVLLRNS